MSLVKKGFIGSTMSVYTQENSFSISSKLRSSKNKADDTCIDSLTSLFNGKNTDRVLPDTVIALWVIPYIHMTIAVVM